MQEFKNVVVLYHANCPDGFGAAFAAWKKFADEASYVPVEHNRAYPKGLDGKEVFICDFSYPDGTLIEIEKKTKRLVVLDHHRGAKEWVEETREHVFDNDRSGAGITWDYLHHKDNRPALINYIEDGDLYRHALPNSRVLLAYIHNQPRTFESWNQLFKDLEDPQKREEMIKIGAIYKEHFDRLTEKIVAMATVVSFEGFECYIASAPEMFASDVGHSLANKKPPLALIVRAEADRISVSMRSDGSVNVSDIAKKYGGGGHPAAAGFRIQYGDSTPWKTIKNEHPRH